MRQRKNAGLARVSRAAKTKTPACGMRKAGEKRTGPKHIATFQDSCLRFRFLFYACRCPETGSRFRATCPKLRKRRVRPAVPDEPACAASSPARQSVPHEWQACELPCASGGRLQPFHGRGARKASHRRGAPSFRERCLRAAISSSGPAEPDRHCYHGQVPAMNFLLSVDVKTDGIRNGSAGPEAAENPGELSLYRIKSEIVYFFAGLLSVVWKVPANGCRFHCLRAICRGSASPRRLRDRVAG